MATSTAVSVEEYLHTTYDPDMEYVNGQLVERHVGEYYHSILQSLIDRLIGAREADGNFVVFTEQRVRVTDEPRFRIPDLCVKALPHGNETYIERPELVIEIVSPDDNFSDVLTKISEYQLAGIPHIWVVDYYRRTLS